MAGNSVNRRGFLGSIAACIGAIAGRFHRGPVSCVACGSSSHVTSLCPINNAAMGNLGSIEVYGEDGRRKGIAKILEIGKGGTMTISSVITVAVGDYMAYASDGSPIGWRSDDRS